MHEVSVFLIKVSSISSRFTVISLGGRANKESAPSDILRKVVRGI